MTMIAPTPNNMRRRQEDNNDDYRDNNPVTKQGNIHTGGCVLSVDMVEVVIGLVAHCGDARLVGDVIEWEELPV